jgi:oligoendopeptidase F
LAETASVFSEMIFSEEFVKTLNDPEAKLAFLSRRLEDIFATIFVQVMYVSFEKEVHELISQGKDLNYTDFNKIWKKHQISLSGDVIDYEDLDETKAFGWSSIPHIFRTPFYVYSYAFGNILTFALYEKYQSEGQDFIEDYKDILRSGGSKTPYDLLIKYGMDINKPEFYEKGIKTIEKILNEFEAEVEKLF